MSDQATEKAKAALQHANTVDVEGDGTDAVQLVKDMIDAINDHVIYGQEQFWSPDMKWYGPAGIGTMHNLKEFQEIHQKAFLKGFPDKFADDEIRFGTGQWAAAHGYQHATHLGEYLGIPATGVPVKVRYMDIWRAEGGQLVENWVLIDLLDFMNQIGIDVLQVVRDAIARGDVVLKTPDQGPDAASDQQGEATPSPQG